MSRALFLKRNFIRNIRCIPCNGSPHMTSIRYESSKTELKSLDELRETLTYKSISNINEHFDEEWSDIKDISDGNAIELKDDDDAISNELLKLVDNKFVEWTKGSIDDDSKQGSIITDDGHVLLQTDGMYIVSIFLNGIFYKI